MGSGREGQGEDRGDPVTFVAKTPTEFRVIPFIILMPSMVAILVEPTWPVIVVVVGILALLVWAAFAARVSVRVGEGHVDIAGPFYRRTIPVDAVDDVVLHRENVGDHSLINWPVVGRATSPAGVRLSLGGTLGPRIVTAAGETYTVFLSSTADAEACTAAISARLDGAAAGRLSPRPGA
jgi:hypothetical protein